MWLTESTALFRQLQGRCRSQIINKLKFSSASKCYSPRKSSSTFSEEEETVIVDTINKCEVSDFAKYDIKEGPLKRLLAQRAKHGTFRDFNDVLMTLDISSLVKFCTSILNGGKQVRSTKGNSPKSIVTPAVTSPMAIKSILGVHVWGNAVSWALLEPDGQINEWHFEQLNLSKMNIISLVSLITELTLRMPHADAYVMEADGYAALGKLKPATYFIHLQRQQIIAMIISGIGMRRHLTNKEEICTGNFYMMQARSPAKMFNLILGSEMVSAKAIISKIIFEQQVMYMPQLPPIIINPRIVTTYNSYDIATREQMHSVLLLTLAFYNQIYVQKNSTLEAQSSA
ncbi:uncharacterized protein LOC135162716 [Diachasmimorpha longicaudata]|uniref:uncharacterized protein LOC135162716 n=1 Tax=Diachasmimorpha longicaudata TaxID=58733 RepID=UPI0030B89157